MEIVRRIYDEGLIDRDPEKWLLELATPEVEYVNPQYAVEPGVRRGPDAVIRAMRGFAEVWENFRHELHELFDGGEVVVASVSWYTRSRGSDSELVQEEAHTWGLRPAGSRGSSGVRISERRSKAAGMRESAS